MIKIGEKSKKEGLVFDASRIYSCSRREAILVGTKTRELPLTLRGIGCPLSPLVCRGEESKKGICTSLVIERDTAFPRVSVVFKIRPSPTIRELYTLLSTEKTILEALSEGGKNFLKFLNEIKENKEGCGGVFFDSFIDTILEYIAIPFSIVFPQVPVGPGGAYQATFVTNLSVGDRGYKSKREFRGRYGVSPEDLSVTYLSDSLVLLFNREKIREIICEILDKIIYKSLKDLGKEEKLAIYAMIARNASFKVRKGASRNEKRLMFWRSNFLRGVLSGKLESLKKLIESFREEYQQIRWKVVEDMATIFYYTFAHAMSITINERIGGMEEYIKYVYCSGVNGSFDEIHFFEPLDGGSAGVLRTLINDWERGGLILEKKLGSQNNENTFRIFEIRKLEKEIIERWNVFLDEHDKFNLQKEEEVRSKLGKGLLPKGFEKLEEVLDEIIEPLRKFSKEDSDFFDIFGFDSLVSAIMTKLKEKPKKIKEYKEIISKIPLKDGILLKLLKEGIGRLCGEGCEECLYLPYPTEGPLMQDFLTSKWIFRAISKEIIKRGEL